MKIQTFLYLALAVLCFLLFAYDIEYDRDFLTWIHLLNAIMMFLNTLLSAIRDEIQKLKNS